MRSYFEKNHYFVDLFCNQNAEAYFSGRCGLQQDTRIVFLLIK